jgi:CRP-like cAMP-binding protein
MSFLDQMSESQRRQFESLAEPFTLPRGRMLLRRGEPGGDIFLLRTGTLEVVDTRSSPELILATTKPGELIGELSFLDDSPRTADVRAASEVQILRWARDDILALTHRDTAFAAEFYTCLAKVAARRARYLAEGASAQAPGRGGGADSEVVGQEARRITEGIKTDLVRLEGRLRNDPGDETAGQSVRGVLDHLEASLSRLFGNMEAARAEATARVVTRELNPYLMRSALAERCLRRPQGVIGSAEILAHILVDHASGDGRLGEILDRWLLDRPTFDAFRRVRTEVPAAVPPVLPTHRNRRVMVVNAGTGSLVSRLGEGMSAVPTVLTVVDQSRDALALLEGSLSDTRGIDLQPVQENLVGLATGRARHVFPPQDAIVLHGLLEYLPDRLAISLLRVARDGLTPQGRLVATALAPTPDEAFVDRVLGWPTVRRTADGFRQLLAAAGVAGEVRAAGQALLVATGALR